MPFSYHVRHDMYKELGFLYTSIKANDYGLGASPQTRASVV